MSTALLPAVTVRSGDRHHTFAPGASVVIGRDAQADITIAHPSVSRAHVVLSYLAGRWVAIDNQSLNGVFVGAQRVRSVDIRGGETIRIGNPDGPELAFDVARPTGGLDVRDLCLGDGAALLDRVSLRAERGSLTAIIGPSGAGKSTLARVLAGATRPTSGTVTFDGHDVHADDAALRRVIGVVPQDDVVHRRLTVGQALGFAAELRLPPDATTDRRRGAVARVLDELGLTAHADTRIEKLSGGQRKRVSIAMELLTEPALLILDEPTTGLDPALDRQVMAMLRGLADAGRVVVVVTHSLAFLDLCDRVLLLAPGGRVAFRGAPRELPVAMGSADWAEIFARVCADPEGAQRHYPNPPPPPVAVTPLPPVARRGLARQVSTVARREVRLLLVDRRYLTFLVLLPLVVGLLPLTVIGDAGFGMPDGDAPLEAKHVIALLNFAAVLMGITLTVRDLVGERTIFRREQAVGLSASAYLAAKIAVFGTVAAVQGVLLVAVVTAPGFGKPAPPSAAALGNPMLELAVGVVATCVAAAVLGLMVSSVARTSDQVIVLLAAALAAQLVLAGGFIPVTGRPALSVIAALTPARWGFAATASTSDLSTLVAGIARDANWSHTASAWLIDIAALAALTVSFSAVARWRLRLR